MLEATLGLQNAQSRYYLQTLDPKVGTICIHTWSLWTRVWGFRGLGLQGLGFGALGVWGFGVLGVEGFRAFGFCKDSRRLTRYAVWVFGFRVWVLPRSGLKQYLCTLNSRL